VIDAKKKAETEATAVTVAAEAEKQAALDQAEAMQTLASAEAEAAKVRAAGVREMGKATAENEQLLNEARNRLSAAIIDYELMRERIKVIPLALAEAVKPIEKISDIKIFDTGGMLGRGGNGAGNGHGNGVGLGDGIAGQLLAYQANKPILDRLLKEAGFDGADPIKALLGGIEAPAAKPGDGVVSVSKPDTPSKK
jgi:flotillin